jgi:hypothetical protein
MEVVQPLIDEDSAAYAAENGIEARECATSEMASMSKDDIISEIKAMQTRLGELMKAAEAL